MNVKLLKPKFCLLLEEKMLFLQHIHVSSQIQYDVECVSCFLFYQD